MLEVRPILIILMTILMMITLMRLVKCPSINRFHTISMTLLWIFMIISIMMPLMKLKSDSVKKDFIILDTLMISLPMIFTGVTVFTEESCII